MKKERAVIVMIVIASVIFLIGGAVRGEEHSDKTLSPYFLIQSEERAEDHFPLKSTDVIVDISGVIADVTVSQIYENMGTHPINARYVFPASTRAAVHGMTMKIGDKIIRARVKEKEAAKKTFETAKKQGKSAGLLEQQRPNVFGMNVANIMPGDIIEIELQYTELLVPANGIYEFVYPTVVGPRYSSQPEATARETDKWVKNPYMEKGTPVSTLFDIHINLSTGMPIQDMYCHTHHTAVDWNGEADAGIRLSDAGDFGGNRDYILNYRLAGEKIESGLTLYEGDEENFFLLMVQPPEQVRPKDIPAREYIFVVDVSGSMDGFPLKTAKRLLFDVIRGLRPSDTFNVVLFAGGSRLMMDSSVPATAANIQQAILFLDSERGGGGTELYKALHRAMQLPRDEAHSRTMVIVTDGYIDAERDVFELIQDNLNQTNVFAFGIGSSVNRYLIEGMARAGQGEPFVVTDIEAAAGKANAFREYISTPVLTGATVRFDGFSAYDIEPPEIPDLFAKRPITVFGKYSGSAGGKVTLTGTAGQGLYEQVFDVSEIEPKETNRALRYLWARSRISRLSDFGVGRPDPDRKAEITNIGLTYNLLTAYTSFVAVLEEIRNPEGDARDVKQPLPLPRGVSNLAVGRYATVPEPELLYLVLGIIVVFLLYRKNGLVEKIGPVCKTRFLTQSRKDRKEKSTC
jgi:Ca-activated chloride channel homolog